MENVFTIENGMVLQGYPRVVPDESVLRWPDKDTQDVDAKLFRENAHFIFENWERVFADSRMFLAPVNVMSGGAYIGPFVKPTVGTYIEWWFRRGKVELAYHVSGSPLSGTNASKAITKDGTLVPLSSGDVFNSSAQEFTHAHNRYLAERKKYEAYSLAEVILRLKGVAPSYDDTVKSLILERKRAALEARIDKLEHELAEMKSRCQSWKDKCRNARLEGNGLKPDAAADTPPAVSN